MFLHMTLFTIVSVLLYGFLSRSEFCGGSVERASAAKVSMIMFTQSICTEVSGEAANMIAPENTMNIATTLTVS